MGLSSYSAYTLVGEAMASAEETYNDEDPGLFVGLQRPSYRLEHHRTLISEWYRREITQGERCLRLALTSILLGERGP